MKMEKMALSLVIASLFSSSYYSSDDRSIH